MRAPRFLACLLALASTFAAAACGPSAQTGDDDTMPQDGGGRPDGWSGPVGAIGGTIWAPGNAPGTVPAGHEIPISGALVYLSLSRPADLPAGVYCEECVSTPGDSAKSDSKGNFSLTGIQPGHYWLTMQKGQFRLDQEVDVAADQTLTLTPQQSTLPSTHDPAAGRYRPHIALAEGLWDEMEDIMGKMGIGQVDGSGVFVGSSAAGNFDLYVNGTSEYDANSIGDLNSLISDLDRMKTYHMILVPCSNGDNSLLFTNPTLRANILEYVNVGGKFYVTDWSAEWEDVVFPEFIRFVSDHDTAQVAGPFNDGDGFPGYESEAAKAEDPDLNVWLNGQIGPQVTGSFGSYQVGTIDADDFVVEGNYDHIQDLGNILIGMDPEGLPVYEQPKAWVMGDWNPGEGPIHPLTVTFEPVGCGRVLYSTYHTADSDHVGLIPQERVLLYLIMEIGECSDNPIIGHDARPDLEGRSGYPTPR